MKFRIHSQIYGIGPGTSHKNTRGSCGDSWRITFADGTEVLTNDLWVCGVAKPDELASYPEAVSRERIDPLPEPAPVPTKPVARVPSTPEKDSYTFVFIWSEGGRRLKTSEATGSLQAMKDRINLANHWTRQKPGREVHVYSPGNFKTVDLLTCVQWVKNVCPKGVGLPF